MTLPRFPVRTGNSFGMHWVGLECGDIRTPDWIRAKLREFRSWGVNWIKIITSPGGDEGWDEGDGLGCSERVFKIALEEGLQPTLRIMSATSPPYITPAREVMLRRMAGIAHDVINANPDGYKAHDWLFACEPANEVDVDTETGGGKPTPEEVARGFVRFAEWCMTMGVFPLVPSVGYGGPGENYLQAYHTINESWVLDECGVALHPYAGAFPVDPLWPWNPILTEGTPVTQEEWDSYNPWCWDIGTGNPRSIEYVNRRRVEDANARAKLTTTEQLFLAYNYGWHTLEWCKWQLSELGHHDTSLFLTEDGTRRGEMYDTLPRVDLILHQSRTLQMVNMANNDPQVVHTSSWLPGNIAYSGNKPNWEDQAWESPWLDRNIIHNLPWPEQIVTDGRLPVIDHLVAHPMGEVKMNKIGMHVQIKDDGLLNIIRDTGAPIPVNKTMDLDPEWCMKLKEAGGGGLLVGRAFVEGQDRYKTDPNGLIDEMLDKYASAIAYLDVIEVPNEVPNNSMGAAERGLFDHFQAEFANRAWARWPMIKIGLFQIPTGNFGAPGEIQLSDFPLSMSLPVDKVFICLHAYSWPSMQVSPEWYVLRHRIIMENYPDHRVIITECGVTNAIIPGQPDVGWRTHGNRESFIQDLVWYNSRLVNDPNVVGAVVFTCGPSWGWDTFESANEVAEAVDRIAIDNDYEPPAPPDPPTPPTTEPDAINLAAIYGVNIEPAAVAPGGPYWKIVRVERLDACENKGGHNVYVDVIDGDQLRVYGAEVEGLSGGEIPKLTVIDKGGLYGGDIPMWNQDNVVLRVDYLGIPSDVVTNLRTNFPEGEYCSEDGMLGNSLYHYSFKVVWQLVTKASVPTDPPDPPDIVDQIRNETWKKIGVRFNPDAAFYKYAQERGLGNPIPGEAGNEFDYEGYRIQAYAGGIVYAPIDKWGETTHIPW